MKQQSSKLSLRQYVWFGFNFVFSLTFVSTFAVFVNASNGNSGIGLHMLWIWVLEGLIAGVCALSFAKLSRHHNVDQGAAYMYTRSTFGRKTGLLVGLVQYVYLPFSLTYQIMSIMRGLFSVDFVNTAAGTPWYVIYFGSFTDIGLDFISIAIFIACALGVFLGMKFYKRLINTSALIKWIAFAFLVVFAIVLATQHGNSNMQYWEDNSKLSFDGFTRTFNSCFFCFVGFELFSTAGRNVENASKNIGKGIIIVMIVATFLFILLTLLFLSATNSFAQNFNMSLWNNVSGSGIGIDVIRYGGPIITMISILFMRINSAMQKSLYGGTTLQPLAHEGFISNRFAILTKENIPKNASKLNMIITLIVALIWLIVPDLIKGITLTSQYGLMPSLAQYQHYDNIFDMASFSSFSSIIAIFVYMMVMLATLKLILDKRIKANMFETIAYLLTLFFLIFFFAYHYYDIAINKLINSYGTDSFAKNVFGASIELSFTILIIGFFVVWYHVYYRKKLFTRIATNPKLQQCLDNEFKLI